MKTRAIYPGTFDPVTLGHLDLIRRAANLFHEIIVAVTTNHLKQPLFDLPTRIMLLEQELHDYPQISVIGFDCLLVDFVNQQQAHVIIRGLRATHDFEYEFQLAGMNRKLAPHIETVFLTPSEDLMFISSSLVKEVSMLHGNVSQFVPPNVEQALQKKHNVSLL